MKTKDQILLEAAYNKTRTEMLWTLPNILNILKKIGYKVINNKTASKNDVEVRIQGTNNIVVKVLSRLNNFTDRYFGSTEPGDINELYKFLSELDVKAEQRIKNSSGSGLTDVQKMANVVGPWRSIPSR